MAASESEFIQKRLETMVGSTTKQARIGIYDANVATLKTRYYLDFVRGVSEYDSNGNEITSRSGFIGGCVVGSDNYYMHNQNRIWSVGGFTQSNEVLFNDAGKNTLGFGEWTTSPMVAYANYIIIPSHFLSAWHVNSTRIGYQVRKLGDTNWITPQLDGTPTTLAQRQSLTKNVAVSIFGNPFNEGDQVQVRAIVQNAEGTYYSSILQVTVGKNINFYSAEFRGASSSCNPGTPVDVIMDDATREWLKTFTQTGDVSTSRYIYSSINPTTGALTPAPQGWYWGLVVGNLRRLIRINTNGEIRQSFLCPEEITEVLIVSFTRVFGSGDDYVATVTVNRSTAFTVPITITGQIQEMNGASVMRSFNYTISLAANAMTADSTPFSKQQAGYKFRFATATASPTSADGVNTNPVKRLDE